MTTPDLSPAPRYLLRVQAGPNSGREHPLLTSAVSLGRDPANDVVLEDDSVSPRHARIEYADGGWRLTDLGSTNGTRVNGEKLPADTPIPLPNGTEVSLGGVKLLLHRKLDAEEGGEGEGGTGEGAATAADVAPGRKIDRPVAGGQEGRSARRRMKLPLWAVVLVVLLIVIIAIVLIAAAPAGIVTAEGSLLLDAVLVPPTTVT